MTINALDLAVEVTWDQTPVLPPEAHRYIPSENVFTPRSRSEAEALAEDDFDMILVDELPTIKVMNTERLMSVVNTGRKKVFT